MERSDIANRMKEFYETVPKTKLMRRCPVAIRIDGRNFHSWTRGFNKPFDEVLIKSMQDTMKYLCENVQGVVLGYCQSDEISLILVDYKKLNSSAFFDYEVQKVCSITASMATMAFNKYFQERVDDYYEYFLEAWNHSEKEEKLFDSYYKSVEKGAMFDSRCFNIPKEEATNYIYWRQLDCIRNSVQMVGQANFSEKELHKKNRDQIKEMLITQKGINWDDLQAYQKYGACCVKKKYQCENVDIKDGSVIRTHWIIDKNIPVFRNDGRQYIERLI